MNGEKEVFDDDDIEVNAAPEDTVVLSDDVLDLDDVDEDLSAEINIERLVAKIEAGDGDAVAHRREIHRRLNELEERRREAIELDSTFNFNLDDEL